MSKYDHDFKRLKCRGTNCDEIVEVDKTTGSVLCWKCTMVQTGGAGFITDEPAPIPSQAEADAAQAEQTKE